MEFHRIWKQISHDEVEPDIYPFYTRHLIWVNYKVVSKLYQPIFISFSYLNSALYNSVFELCRELKVILFSFL